jgi:hypothetical protein
MYMRCPTCKRHQLADEYCHYCGANCMISDNLKATRDDGKQERTFGWIKRKWGKVK